MPSSAVTNSQAQAASNKGTYASELTAQQAVVAAASTPATLEAAQTKLRMIEGAYRAMTRANDLADLLT